MIGIPLKGESFTNRMPSVTTWDLAQYFSIINRYPQYCAVSDEKMARAICHRCHQIIEPLYREKGAKKFAKPQPIEVTIPVDLQVKTFGEIHSKLMPILDTLGPMLSVDPVLYSKIVRLLRTFFKEYKASTDKESLKPVFATLLSILEDVLFPTVTLLDCCVVQSEEIWQILKNLDYELRYRLYGYWKNASYKLHPRLILSQACFRTLLHKNDVITYRWCHCVTMTS